MKCGLTREKTTLQNWQRMMESLSEIMASLLQGQNANVLMHVFRVDQIGLIALIYLTLLLRGVHQFDVLTGKAKS